MRLIDADEFWNRLSNADGDFLTVHVKDGRLTNTASVGYYTETIQEVLKQTKTVDAVPVVRCKDCIYNEKSSCFFGQFANPHYRPDHFCADGERKTDG